MRDHYLVHEKILTSNGEWILTQFGTSKIQNPAIFPSIHLILLRSITKIPPSQKSDRQVLKDDPFPMDPATEKTLPISCEWIRRKEKHRSIWYPLQSFPIFAFIFILSYLYRVITSGKYSSVAPVSMSR